MASTYDPFLWFGERRGMREWRRRRLASAAGRVVEIGAGTGLNVEHYGSAIEELVLTGRAFANGCRCSQDTLALIDGALSVDHVERQTWSGMPPIVQPVISGEAVR